MWTNACILYDWIFLLMTKTITNHAYESAIKPNTQPIDTKCFTDWQLKFLLSKKKHRLDISIEFYLKIHQQTSVCENGTYFVSNPTSQQFRQMVLNFI